jgi:hypothetical protein
MHSPGFLLPAACGVLDDGPSVSSNHEPDFVDAGSLIDISEFSTQSLLPPPWDLETFRFGQGGRC